MLDLITLGAQTLFTPANISLLLAGDTDISRHPLC